MVPNQKSISLEDIYISLQQKEMRMFYFFPVFPAGFIFLSVIYLSWLILFLNNSNNC